MPVSRNFTLCFLLRPVQCASVPSDIDCFSVHQQAVKFETLLPFADKVRAESEKKRIMILMSDTGGGHRASAEALKAGFEKLYGDKYKVYTSA